MTHDYADSLAAAISLDALIDRSDPDLMLDQLRKASEYIQASKKAAGCVAGENLAERIQALQNELAELRAGNDV